MAKNFSLYFFYVRRYQADSLKIPNLPKYMEIYLEFFFMIWQWAPVLFTVSMIDLLRVWRIQN